MKIYIKYFFILLIFQVIIGCKDSSIFANSEIKKFIGKWSVGGGIASIEYVSNNQLKLTTETGLVGLGNMDGKNLVISAWNVTGRLDSRNSIIYWSNLTVWKNLNENK